jgi:hypothetical protein
MVMGSKAVKYAALLWSDHDPAPPASAHCHGLSEHKLIRSEDTLVILNTKLKRFLTGICHFRFVEI